MRKVRVCDKLISLLLVLVFVTVYSGFLAIYTSAGAFLPDGIHSFYIGKNSAENVAAEFNSDFTELHIFPASADSDGIMMDWLNPDDSGYTYNPAYEHSDTLERIIIDNGIVNIGDYFLYECDSVENLTFPESIISIGNSSFRKTGITALNLPPHLTSIGERAFSGCHSLKGDIIIPDFVTWIGDRAFYNCDFADGNLVLGNSVRIIGRFAFDRCFKLTGSLTLPDSVEIIGAYCFENCENLNGKLVLNEGLKHIGDGAFNHCKSFTNTELVISSSVMSIGGDTAYAVTFNSATAVEPPQEYYNHSSHTFYDFANATLVSFSVAEGNMNFTSVEGVLYSDDMKRLIAYPSSKEGSVFEIPEGVEIIDEMAFGKTAFGSAEEPLKTLILPDSYVIRFADDYQNTLNREAESSLNSALYSYSTVEEIITKPTNPNYASYDGCVYTKDMSQLITVPSGKTGTVELPLSVSSVCYGAFSGCYNVEYVIIPRAVTDISEIAFSECSAELIGYKGSAAEAFGSENGLDYYNFGDMNTDGTITLDDYALLSGMISGASDLTDKLVGILADYDRDTAADAFDLFMVDKEINA